LSNTFKAHLALFGANLIYGINYTAAKEVMPDFIMPFGFILCRVIGATLFFWLIHSAISNEKVERRDFILLFVCGFFGVALNQLSFFKGLNITTPINASIIMTATPILVLIASSLLIKERITWIKTIGIVIGLIGAVSLLLFKGNTIQQLEFGSDTIKGDLFILLNASSYGVYLVIVKPLMKKYHPVTVVKWVFLFGLMFVIPFGWEEVQQISWSNFTVKIWGCFGFVVIATTCFAYLFNIYALKNVSPSVVSSYIYLQPVIASLIALLAEKDSLTWIKGLATLLIFVGVYLVSQRPKKLTA